MSCSKAELEEGLASVSLRWSLLKCRCLWRPCGLVYTLWVGLTYPASPLVHAAGEVDAPSNGEAGQKGSV